MEKSNIPSSLLYLSISTKCFDSQCSSQERIRNSAKLLMGDFKICSWGESVEIGIFTGTVGHERNDLPSQQYNID